MNERGNGRNWYTVKEAAGILGYAEGAIRKMLNDGDLKAGQRKRWAQLRITKASVEAVLDRLNGNWSE